MELVGVDRSRRPKHHLTQLRSEPVVEAPARNDALHFLIGEQHRVLLNVCRGNRDVTEIEIKRLCLERNVRCDSNRTSAARGVVLGTLLAASGAGIVPYAPQPNLCWYWADPYMIRRYWDYCY
jgi:hypothetical protein